MNIRPLFLLWEDRRAHSGIQRENLVLRDRRAQSDFCQSTMGEAPQTCAESGSHVVKRLGLESRKQRQSVLAFDLVQLLVGENTALLQPFYVI